MGYDFFSVYPNEDTGEQDYFQLNIWGWPEVFKLAVANGYEPTGTKLQTYNYNEEDQDGAWVWNDDGTPVWEDDWSGTYFSNDGQTISSEDADNFASALSRWLDKTDAEKEADGWSLDSWWVKEGCQECINYFINSAPIRIH